MVPRFGQEAARLGVRTKDMLGIFDPDLFNGEQRGSGPISPDPFGTGRFSARAASRAASVGPATARHPLLTLAENRSRHGDRMNVNRP